MIDTNYLREKNRVAITSFLQWEDRNGSYTDKNSDIEGVKRMLYEDAIKYFFGVINSEIYFAIADNIFELTYEEVIKYSKEFNIYDKTMYKMRLLFKQNNNTKEFYRSLID
ncbi:hypothetical protein [Clostridium sp. CF012]|uniref:hypothetical protein n=1 Tax=Clostridium sp. CF012 TaxID=2843319 RepID=UPI001C0D601B|nr:hypothetical protein [Clostridium sp. CF012]MBU3144626.1 hypothetical protein [Clostridium sp. CF012]